jgi:putative transposase
MALSAFAVGQKFKIGNDYFAIKRLLEGALVQYEALPSGIVTQCPMDELLTMYSVGDLRFHRDMPSEKSRCNAHSLPTHLVQAWNDGFRQDYQDEDWNRAQAKLKLIKLLEGVPSTANRLTSAIDEVWEKFRRTGSGAHLKNKPHFTTVARWRAKYGKAQGDIRSLIERRAEKGNRESRTPPELDELIEQELLRTYLVPEKGTISDVLAAVNANVLRLNRERKRQLECPLPAAGKSLVRARLRQLWSPRDQFAARHGKKAADVKFRAAMAGFPARRPMERASMDHTRMDVFVIDDKTRLPLGRPWLTVIIDDCTRIVLGYSISFEPPSAVSVARALRHAMLPKADFLSRFRSVQGGWDAWGVIETLILDNGMEFHGESIERFSEQFGTALQFCPRRKAWYKGRIERFFGTLNTGLLHTIPGTTFSNIFKRGAYNPKKHALVTLDTLKEMVATWVVDVYHRSNHAGLCTTPQKEWNRLISAEDRLLPDSSAWMDIAFSKRLRDRKSDHTGLHHDSLRYNSAELRIVREQYGTQVLLDVFVNDEDVGSVFIMVPDRGEILEIPAVNAEYARGLSRWQHQTIKKYRRRLAELNDDELISLADAKARIQELVDADRMVNKNHGTSVKARYGEHARPMEGDARSPTKGQALNTPPNVGGATLDASKKIGGRIKGVSNVAA